MAPPMQSAIWTYFKPDDDRNKSQCIICNKTYSRKGRTTSSLKNHLKSMQPEQFSLFESSTNEKQMQKMKADAHKILTPLQEAKKQLSIEEAVQKEKKWDTKNSNSKKNDKLIGEMIALQNLSFNFVEGLDRRYKHKFFTPVTEENIKDDILKIRTNIENDVSNSQISPNFKAAKKMKMGDSLVKDTEQPGTSGTARKPCLKSDLAMMLDSSSEDESQEISENGSPDAVLKKELLSYRNKARLNINENPLKWWSVNRSELKILYGIARRFLSPPPASVPSEELFSSAGLIYEPLRNRLEPEKAAILLFIKYNSTIFKISY
ncbi:hypothetical protein Zmor_006328 [Zophobas morio]|uniref:BED-type domain-containing protein n=1 Tax=Zophobas morio TaxID=2755281 RepID=A0AA38MMQ5_9CUCU|nr:hypothetical protein Zmor_006328 [Zophobas morio]